MGYQQTKHTVVTASAATGLAKWNAIRDHFNGNSFKWVLTNPADPTGTGLWLQKVGGQHALLLRRDTAGSTWYAGSVVDGLVASPGNATTPATVSGLAEADYVIERQHVPDTTHTKMLVIEHDDAVTILEWNATENAFPKGIHMGLGGAPVDATMATAGRHRGNVVLTGAPALNGAGASVANWFSGSGSTTTNSQMARAFGVNYWPVANILDSAVVIGDAPGNLITTAAVPYSLVPHSGSAVLLGFFTKYLRFVSCDAVGAGPAGTRYEVGGDAWVRVSSTNTTSARLCINCEPGKAVR